MDVLESRNEYQYESASHRVDLIGLKKKERKKKEIKRNMNRTSLHARVLISPFLFSSSIFLFNYQSKH